MIHPIIKDTPSRLYCGPTALAALTGLPTSKIFKMVRRVRGDADRRYYGKIVNGGHVLSVTGRKRPIKSMWNSEMITVLHRAGLKVADAKSLRRVPEHAMTLGEFCDDRGHSGPYLLEVTRHYVVVSHGQIIDTLTGYKPIPWREYKKLRTKVKQWWKF